MSNSGTEETNRLKIVYKNHRGYYSERHIILREVWFGKSQWHEGRQWFLRATDIEKDAPRDFALVDILRIVEG